MITNDWIQTDYYKVLYITQLPKILYIYTYMIPKYKSNITTILNLPTVYDYTGYLSPTNLLNIERVSGDA